MKEEIDAVMVKKIEEWITFEECLTFTEVMLSGSYGNQRPHFIMEMVAKI